MSAHLEPSFILTHAGAFAMLKGAIAMAAEMQVPASIAVVDAGGDLLAFLRLDGAPVSSQRVAIEKAVSAVATASGPRGGLPVVVEGRVVGGIGVSAGRADHDVMLAQAGLACLQTGAARVDVR
jgi:uncharacterized protein GlcG (DUF336 family)